MKTTVIPKLYKSDKEKWLRKCYRCNKFIKKGQWAVEVKYRWNPKNMNNMFSMHESCFFDNFNKTIEKIKNRLWKELGNK